MTETREIEMLPRSLPGNTRRRAPERDHGGRRRPAGRWQFPQWAGLPVVPVKTNGWDNITFRLGSELSIRLPSADGYAAQVGKEHRWLPALARQLPLPIPEPVAIGRRDEGFPRPWSIYRWIEGEPPSAGQVADPAGFASDLAGFLSALTRSTAATGRRPGHTASSGEARSPHGTSRSGGLIRVAADDVDAKGVIRVWGTALATSPRAAEACY